MVYQLTRLKVRKWGLDTCPATNCTYEEVEVSDKSGHELARCLYLTLPLCSAPGRCLVALKLISNPLIGPFVSSVFEEGQPLEQPGKGFASAQCPVNSTQRKG